MFCSKCNNEIPDNSVVCLSCGNVIQNPFKEMNKNAVGMNRSLATDPSNVQTQSQPINTSPIEQQPVNSTPIAPQIANNQTVQNFEPTNANQVIDTTIPKQEITISKDKLTSIVSIIVLVVSIIMGISFLISTCGSLPYGTTSELIKNLFISLFIIALVIILTNNAIKNYDSPYLQGLAIGSGVIFGILLLYFIYIGAFKSVFTFIFIKMLIPAILIFYNAYYLSKKIAIYVINKLCIFTPIKEKIVTAGIIITMYDISIIIYAYIIFKIVFNTIARSFTL